MTLREQIARRLWDCYSPTEGRVWGSLDKTGWLQLADEVIRLMEWARRQNLQAFKAGVIEYVDPGLTLPPEDWKP